MKRVSEKRIGTKVVLSRLILLIMLSAKTAVASCQSLQSPLYASFVCSSASLSARGSVLGAYWDAIYSTQFQGLESSNYYAGFFWAYRFSSNTPRGLYVTWVQPMGASSEFDARYEAVGPNSYRYISAKATHRKGLSWSYYRQILQWQGWKITAASSLHTRVAQGGFSDAVQVGSSQSSVHAWLQATHPLGRIGRVALHVGGPLNTKQCHSSGMSYGLRLSLDATRSYDYTYEDYFKLKMHATYPALSTREYYQRSFDSQVVLPAVSPEGAAGEAIPAYLFQTHYDKQSIPPRITQECEHYSRSWQRFLLDDDDVRAFLIRHYPNLITTFDYLKGAHRADFARYLLLYTYGGVYVDIKTTPLMPLDDIIDRKQNLLTTARGELEIVNATPAIWQGVIASPPRNPFLWRLVENGVAHVKEMSGPKKRADELVLGAIGSDLYSKPQPLHYFFFIIDFYNEILKDTEQKVVERGYNAAKDSEGLGFYILSESCAPGTQVRGMRCEKPDRYGLCCYLFDGNRPVFKGRDCNYPWS